MENQDYLEFLTLPKSLYDKIEKDVVDLFLQLNIHSFPVNPSAIALQLGYELNPFSKMNKDAKSMLVFRDVDGISHFDPMQNTSIIYYRPDGLKERLRFTIAYEIGHIRMGHKGESELARRIADYYAAYLLAPSPWIGQAGCEDFLDVASAFALSDACAMRCFERFEHWRQIPFTKSYEKDIIALLKNGSKRE